MQYISAVYDKNVIALVLISNAYRCRCYSEKLSNSTFDEIRQIYSAYEKPSCTVINETEILYLPEADLVHQIYTFDYLRSEDDNKAPISCDKWIYKLDYGYHSMTSDVSLKNILLLHVTFHNLVLYISQLDWVCDSAWKSTLGQSLFFIGSVIGSLLFGVWADRIGRLPVLVISNLMAMIGNGATIFATNVVAFAICRFIAGLATDTNFVMMYILGKFAKEGIARNEYR